MQVVRCLRDVVVRICTLTENRVIHVPFPTVRLAKTATRSLSVDPELSPLVRRSFQLVASPSAAANSAHVNGAINGNSGGLAEHPRDDKAVLEVVYAATTNRMLRVAVNGFFESLGLVVQVMEELDDDVVMKPGSQGFEGVQGLEEVKWQD